MKLDLKGNVRNINIQVLYFYNIKEFCNTFFLNIIKLMTNNIYLFNLNKNNSKYLKKR